jgi:hypothetical protein
MALLREGTLVDDAGKYLGLELTARSSDGAYVLFYLNNGEPDTTWELAKVSDFTSFAAIRPISCIFCNFLGFVPHSDEVYGYQNNINATVPSIDETPIPNWDYNGLSFVNPQNPGSLIAQIVSAKLPANIVVYVHGGLPPTQLDVINWGGSPSKVIVAYEFKNSSENQDFLAFSNLKTGEVD